MVIVRPATAADRDWIATTARARWHGDTVVLGANVHQLKPSIPPTGDQGIPIHDEIELELDLGGGQ
ncbi:MAG TPA: hypothetical protein VEK76_03335 [Candidatus Binatia bacterium]|nr:hypothetical protein [Candidatus Binatia bacterium]